MQLSGYSHTARIGPHLKADGQAYRPAGAYGYYNKIKGANPGNLSEDDNHYRFPGETQEEHESLLEFVDEMAFDRLGVFPYSPEEDTPAALFEDQVDEAVKLERQADIMELQQEIAFEKAQAAVGSTMLVMVEGRLPDEHAYVARSYKDAPNVDGFVFIQTERELMTGDFVRVKITGSYEYDLIGEITGE